MEFLTDFEGNAMQGIDMIFDFPEMITHNEVEMNKTLKKYSRLLSTVQEALDLNKKLLEAKNKRKYYPYFTSEYNKKLKLFELLFCNRSWGIKETNALQKAIARQCLMQSFDIETEKSNLELLVESQELELDWDQVAREVKTKSDIECMSEWKFNKYPLLNFKEFTQDELQELSRLVEKYKGTNWHLIAKELGNGRVAWHVYKTFIKKLKGTKRKWSLEEDEILKESVSKLGKKSWIRVAAFLPNRSPKQCLQRWNFALSPKIKKGRWSKEEDLILLKGIEEHGRGKWSLIKVPGRTDAQIRERFENVLNPDLNRGPWSEAERKLLKSLVESIGPKWSIISQELPNRTDNMCVREWKRIQRKGYENAIKHD